MSIKFLDLGGGGIWVFFFWGGGGSADFIFMGARIFLTCVIFGQDFYQTYARITGDQGFAQIF